MNNGIEKPSPCSTGLTPEISVLLAYMFGWVSGIIFLVIEKKEDSVRFHAMQSTVMSIGTIALTIVLSTLTIIPILGVMISILISLVGVAYLVVAVIIVYKKFYGEDWRLPFVGDLSLKLLASI